MHLVSQARYARDRIDIPHAGAQPNPFWEESKVRLLAKALFYMWCVVTCLIIGAARAHICNVFQYPTVSEWPKLGRVVPRLADVLSVHDNKHSCTTS
jgi:hypothetical protein